MVVDRQGARAIVLMPCLLGLLCACGASHGMDGGPDGGLDADLDAAPPTDVGPPDAPSEDAGVDLSSEYLAFCARAAELECGGHADCCTDPGRGGCDIDRRRARCEELASDPALRDGTLVWRADRVAGYLSALDEALASCGARARAWPRWYGAPFEGTLSAGEDCTPSEPGLRSLGIYRCEEGLRCELTGDGTGYTGICAAPGGVGDSCNHDCDTGLYCLFDGRTETPFWGRCEVQDDAAECLTDFACSSIYCSVGMCIEPDPADTWCSILG